VIGETYDTDKRAVSGTLQQREEGHAQATQGQAASEGQEAPPPENGALMARKRKGDCACKSKGGINWCCDYCGRCFMCHHRLYQQSPPLWKCHTGDIVLARGSGEQELVSHDGSKEY